MAQHLNLTPAQYISLFSDVDWEEFVLEWATGLTPTYETVMRSGGANDHGVDVAGFATSQGFDDEWDCYQCKHYGRPLNPSDAHSEILKIVQGTLAGHYSWPRKYRFAAPQGYGTLFANMLHSPSNLKAALIAALNKDKSPLHKKVGDSMKPVLEFVEKADFSVFGAVELHELVEQHSKTRWHSARFAVPLPTRLEDQTPSNSPQSHEQNYIQKLLDAYSERHPGVSVDTVSTAHETSAHYSLQRRAFYGAESLRVFARDSVPENTFGKLQNEIHDGTTATYGRAHADGWERLDAVSDKATALSLTANPLLPVLFVSDKIGICHQLANDGRMTWCRASSQ